VLDRWAVLASSGEAARGRVDVDEARPPRGPHLGQVAQGGEFVPCDFTSPRSPCYYRITPD
jgi:hypothetical protein